MEVWFIWRLPRAIGPLTKKRSDRRNLGFHRPDSSSVLHPGHDPVQVRKLMDPELQI